MTREQADWIAHRAYMIWRQEDCPEGCALRHWLQAEEDLCEAERLALARDAEAGGVPLASADAA